MAFSCRAAPGRFAGRGLSWTVRQVVDFASPNGRPPLRSIRDPAPVRGLGLAVRRRAKPGGREFQVDRAEFSPDTPGTIAVFSASGLSGTLAAECPGVLMEASWPGESASR